MMQFLLSNDLNMQILASAKGVETINLLGLIKENKIYDGYRVIYEDVKFIDTLYKNKSVKTDKPYYENEYLCIKNDSMNQSALARFNNGEIKLINDIDNVWGIKARTMEQRFVIDALLDDNINLVTIIGSAGTGKTLLAVACAIKKVIEDTKYKKITGYETNTNVWQRHRIFYRVPLRRRWHRG